MKNCGQHGFRFPLLQVVAVLTLSAAGIGCRPVESESPAISAGAGPEWYEMYCATCHMDGAAYFPTPALKGSELLAGPPSNTIRVILYGQSEKSKIDGIIAGGIMPAQAGLTNEEIAGIVNFVRAEFAGKDDAVSPSEVEALRIK
jgi:mono/diheme cytochrome c family protein